MPSTLDSSLQRWLSAGLIDPATAERIRAYESAREKRGGLRWPVVLALAFGAVLVGAGVLLFVSAHWDKLAPGSRFALVLLLVAAFHVVGALSERGFPQAATTFHALGTVALGGGVFLTGQIFNLQEHWPGGFMIWAAGAWIGWWLRRDWPQATLAAILTPIWLSGEWIEATRQIHFHGVDVFLGQWLVLLALVYLGARTGDLGGPVRRSLAWCGGLALIPAAFAMGIGTFETTDTAPWPALLRLAGWTGSLGLPLLLAWILRRRAAWVLVGWAGWVVIFGFLLRNSRADMAGLAALGVDYGGPRPFSAWEAGRYLWLALGAVALAAWGVRERRGERINLGVVGFALTVLVFYFSNLMDKMGRATSLIGLGLLFLGGGWLLERMRRRLVAGITGVDG